VKVTISFIGPLRDQVGKPALEVELPDGATYRDLLDEVAPLMQSKLADWAWDTATRSFSRRLMVSRNVYADLRDDTTPLSDDDEIVVFLPLAGG